VGILVAGYRDGAGAVLRRRVSGEVCLPLSIRVADIGIGVTSAAAGTASDAGCHEQAGSPGLTFFAQEHTSSNP